ncbi:MAG: cupredoxin domain-containing protein [Chloroflexi bacterium]|nr:cupredoxin domain-containing protein [Chloroflexota bacterium]
MVARRTNRLLVSAALLSALLFAACTASDDSAQPPATGVAPANGALTVRAFEWGYEPEAIVLQRGEEVRIVLDNDGEILHNLKIDGLEAELIESRSTGPLSGGEGQLFVGADDGQQGTLIFVPQQSGEFTFYCTLERHRQLGMEGTLIVE